LFITSDAGGDQNSKFFATRYMYGRLFRKFDLDMLIIVHLAPGFSAYNPVERLMSSLSQVLCNQTISSTVHGKNNKDPA